MTHVIKRSGRKQKYSQAKLERSIEKAAREAKITKAKRKKIVKEVAVGIHKAVRRRRAIRSTELRKRVLRRLENRSRAAVAAWRRFDRRRSRKQRYR